MGKSMLTVVSAAVVALAVAASGCSKGPDAIQRVAVFTDAPGNQIYLFSFRAGVPRAAIQEHAEQLGNAPGQFTSAYYFPEGAPMPTDQLVRAGNVIEANNALYRTLGFSDWHYAGQLSVNGQRIFVNCLERADQPLCRSRAPT